VARIDKKFERRGKFKNSAVWFSQLLLLVALRNKQFLAAWAIFEFQNASIPGIIHWVRRMMLRQSAITAVSRAGSPARIH
jgi:hypothetical protein